MQSTWNKTIAFVAAALFLPINLLAHPGHEGHGGAPVGLLTGSDYVTTVVIVTGIWERARYGDRCDKSAGNLLHAGISDPIAIRNASPSSDSAQ